MWFRSAGGIPLPQEAAAAPGFRSLVDVDAPDFAAPGDMPARLQAFCRRTGQPVPETKGEIVRCGLPEKAGELVQDVAAKSGALFLLDGLDEAGDEQRREQAGKERARTGQGHRSSIGRLG